MGSVEHFISQRAMYHQTYTDRMEPLFLNSKSATVRVRLSGTKHDLRESILIQMSHS